MKTIHGMLPTAENTIWLHESSQFTKPTLNPSTISLLLTVHLHVSLPEILLLRISQNNQSQNLNAELQITHLQKDFVSRIIALTHPYLLQLSKDFVLWPGESSRSTEVTSSCSYTLALMPTFSMPLGESYLVTVEGKYWTERASSAALSNILCNISINIKTICPAITVREVDSQMLLNQWKLRFLKIS